MNALGGPYGVGSRLIFSFLGCRRTGLQGVFANFAYHLAFKYVDFASLLSFMGTPEMA
jgi:hypothetical protein